MPQHDFEYADHGTIKILYPISEAALQWVDENLPSVEDRTDFGGGVVIEHRYAADILEGISQDNLSIAA